MSDPLDEGATLSSGGAHRVSLLPSGAKFGQYRIVRLLGRGGMGEVYEAEHQVLRRCYALKLLPATIDWQGVSLERFRREAQVMAHLEHQNILKVDDFGEVDGRYWLRMELAEGVESSKLQVAGCALDRVVSLQDLADACGGKVPQDVLLPILKQVLAGLEYAHAHGAIHRDLKPSNILLFPSLQHSNTPLVKISDFGLVRLVGEEWVRSQAQLSVQQSMSLGDSPTGGGRRAVGAEEGTSTRALLGTYEYMSPEQKRGEEADARSDLYAAGVMTYRLLTGRNISPKPPSRVDSTLHADWDELVEAALEENRKDRIGDAKGFLARLNRIGGQGAAKIREEERERQQREDKAREAVRLRAEAERKRETEARRRAAEEARTREQARAAAAKPQAAPPPKPAAAKTGMGWWPLVAVAVVIGGIWLANRKEAPPPRPSATPAPPVVAAAPKLVEPAASREVPPAPVPALTPTASYAAGTTRAIDLGGGVTMEMVWIPAGSFTMGSPDNEPERFGDEGPQHRVTISSGFWMGKTEVTQEQWKRLMGSNPSNFKGARNPVEMVTWNDARDFCGKLQDRLPTDMRGKKARLPTEAEWEYACRAGTAGPFNTGNCLSTAQANYDGNYPLRGCAKGDYRQKTVAVGSFAPNAWGLYDMHGNVWEWCWDGERQYTSAAQTDPEGAGSSRVLRGGSWINFAGDCRSANRYVSDPGNRYNYIGFRVVVR